MSLHMLDLRPIKTVSTADKDNLAVSIAILPNGTPVVVSRYRDLIWDFYPYIPQENQHNCQKQIDWRIALPDGNRLTDPVHAVLLESTRDFIWSLFADPVEGRKRPTMRTLRHKVDFIKPLLRWMVSLGLMRFAELGGRTLGYVPWAKLSDKGKPAAIATATARLLVVEDLYNQRDKLNDALRVHPWQHEGACSLAGNARSGDHRLSKTE